MEGRACHLRQRACPGVRATGDGGRAPEQPASARPPARPKSCNTIIMIGERRQDLQAHRFSWSACDGQWTLIGLGAREPSLNGREGVPLETAGVPRSSRHRPDHLQDRRAVVEIRYVYMRIFTFIRQKYTLLRRWVYLHIDHKIYPFEKVGVYGVQAARWLHPAGRRWRPYKDTRLTKFF